MAIQECRASVSQTIEKLVNSVAVDGGSPNVSPLKCRVGNVDNIDNNFASAPSYVKVHLIFNEIKNNAGRRDLRNSRGANGSNKGGILHTFGHYQNVNTDTRWNPLQKSIVLLLSSQPRIRPGRRERRNTNRGVAQLCNCIVEDTTRRVTRSGEWGITVRIDAASWKNVKKHTSLMGEETHVYVWLIQKLSTQLRELDALTNASSMNMFAALKGVSSSYDYKELGSKKPVVDLTTKTSVEVDSHFYQFLNTKFTESQRNAILSSAVSRGVTLIQGPPGTGKTYTLHALMNTNQLHHSNVYNRTLMASIWNKMKSMKSMNANNVPKSGSEWWSWLLRLKIPSKASILLVAPSNEAVDNLYKSIVTGKFVSFDVNGLKQRYSPKLVRIGLGGKDKTIDNISVKVKKFMQQDPQLIEQNKTKLNEMVLYHETKLGEALTRLFAMSTQTNEIANSIVTNYNTRRDRENELNKYNMLGKGWWWGGGVVVGNVAFCGVCMQFQTHLFCFFLLLASCFLLLAFCFLLLASCFVLFFVLLHQYVKPLTPTTAAKFKNVWKGTTFKVPTLWPVR